MADSEIFVICESIIFDFAPLSWHYSVVVVLLVATSKKLSHVFLIDHHLKSDLVVFG